MAGDAGLIASVPHGTELVPPTRRFHLTADGLRPLAQEEGIALDALRDLAGLLGVSEQRASQLTTALEGFGLSARVPAAA